MKEKSLGQKTSPYDLYSYNNIPTNSLPHDIRLRPGNVIFNHNLEWLNDNMGSRVDYSAPGHGCTTMLYNVDGSCFLGEQVKKGSINILTTTDADGGLQHGTQERDHSSERIDMGSIEAWILGKRYHVETEA
ncbi:unnamed protein product [Lactuca virosa]|uniref:Uncharacterized protein n=1 Tax=Lactuca virosa TaxID=75947 RepID=A0AAU9PC73_9ASTR|nr:unnamed protein product [Lactuca virosa]